MSIEWHKNRENVRKKRQEEFVFHEKLIQFYWAMAKFFMSLLPIKDWFWKEIHQVETKREVGIGSQQWGLCLSWVGWGSRAGS